jgi:AcrR family transcriptional regulator
MVKATVVKPDTTSKAATRTLAQRERILVAAQHCFIEFGFHAASMASIAETAKMSPGLIYRYFNSKNEIIVAIIERQLVFLRAEIAMLDGSIDLPSILTEGYGGCRPGQTEGLSPALILEMSAEATRDPKIAEALAAFDNTVRKDIADWLGRSEKYGGQGLSRRDTVTRALILQCLIEGLKVRQTREPELDRALLKSALDEVLSVLLHPAGSGDKSDK